MKNVNNSLQTEIKQHSSIEKQNNSTRPLS